VTNPFEQNLAKLKNVKTTIAADDVPDGGGMASVVVTFSDGTVLKANYWRLIQNGRAIFSSFDHQHKYGLPAPIDAKIQLSGILNGQICQEVLFDRRTADLTLVFGGTTELQVFNFTGYEMWEIQFPDGTGQYSNYARA
jgi:hypothetical protein